VGSGALAGGGALSANLAITMNTPGNLGVGIGNSSATNHTHAIATESNPGTTPTILANDNTGNITLTQITTPIINSATTITLNAIGDRVLPRGHGALDLGDYNRKWRSIFAMELYVEILTAQSVISTIGGRVDVAPTAKLKQDLISVADGTNTLIYVDTNSFAVGDFLFMAALNSVGVPQIEAMKITAGPTDMGSGEYRYNVNRGDGNTTPKTWATGNAVQNWGGAVGEGYISLTATQTAFGHLGPTITIYSRSGTSVYSNMTAVATFGNLRSFVDYSVDEFGTAAGNDLTLTPITGFKGYTIDRNIGMRLFNVELNFYDSATLAMKLAPASGLTFYVTNSFEDPRSITFKNSGGAEIGKLTARDIGAQNILSLHSAIAGSVPASVYIEAVKAGNTETTVLLYSHNGVSATQIELFVNNISSSLIAEADVITLRGNTGIGVTVTSTASDSTFKVLAVSNAVVDLATDAGTVVCRLLKDASSNSFVNHYGTAGNFYVGTIVAADMFFRTNSLQRMRINGDGTILFGSAVSSSSYNMEYRIDQSAVTGFVISNQSTNAAATAQLVMSAAGGRSFVVGVADSAYTSISYYAGKAYFDAGAAIDAFVITAAKTSGGIGVIELLTGGRTSAHRKLSIDAGITGFGSTIWDTPTTAGTHRFRIGGNTIGGGSDNEVFSISSTFVSINDIPLKFEMLSALPAAVGSSSGAEFSMFFHKGKPVFSWRNAGSPGAVVYFYPDIATMVGQTNATNMVWKIATTVTP
jgi:hypothetical protein